MNGREPPRPGVPAVQSESLFRALVEAVNDYAIFMLDPQGHVITWNAGARRLKGYAAEEIIGQHFSSFYPTSANERGWPDHELRVAAAEGRFEDEGWRVRKDGTRFWANVVITRVTDENGVLQGFSKVTRDLTERRRQEETLRESEQRFRLLVESVTDYAIFMIDPQGYVQSWNAGATRIKGYTPEEIIGRHFSVFYPPELVAADWPAHELRVARSKGRYEEEAWRMRKDGSRFWANVLITAVYDAAGTLQGYAKITRDLTQRKQMEALEDAGRKMDEFMAMLGHELRNPLAPIRNAVQVMRMFRLGDAKLEWCRDVIDRQVEHLGRLVDDLLDVNRITTGKIFVMREPIDLSAALERAVESSMPLINARRHTLNVSLTDKSPQVEGDLMRLAQVFLNLLNNAAKYTPEGGCIRLTSSVEDGNAVVRVSDNGVGITPELLPRIFDLFVQGTRTLERAEGGLGIGLTLVREIVRLHGGTISATSAGSGLGSEFTVRLPLMASKSAEPPQPVPGAHVIGPTRRVLIVDDNRDAAASIALLLTAFGHEVETVHEGPAALARVGEFAPDAVLLDIGLPGMSAHEVAGRLRAMPDLKQPTLIAVTGYAQAEDRKRSIDAGFDYHFVKPVNFEALNTLLCRDLPR
jgi:PAS domain S-box-containing protein